MSESECLVDYWEGKILETDQFIVGVGIGQA